MVKIIDSQITDIHSEMTAIGNILYQFMHTHTHTQKTKLLESGYYVPGTLVSI
jgi:hypothetical protein